MKEVVPLLIAALLLPVAWDASIRLSERYDTAPEYIVAGISRLEVPNGSGEYESHAGAYKAGSKLYYCTERQVTRTVTAKPARRIVQVVQTPKGISRTHIYTFPVVNPSVGVRRTPDGVSEFVHVAVDLPGPDVLHPGKGYVLESSLEFPPHGEREAQTYTAQTETFDVE